MGKDKDQKKRDQKEPDIAAHPVLVRQGSFEGMALGRVEAFHDPRTLRLAKYLDDAVVLPEIPETFDLVPAVASWPMYGNDSLGDCTIAAAAHMVQAWYAANGQTVTPDEAAVIAAYWATGSSDTGRFEVEVLNFWRREGIAGDKIVAYAYVDAKNLDHVRAALYLFGGLYNGIALPKTAQTQAVWDVVGDGLTGDSQPNSWGGHATPYLPRWDGEKIPLVTWGHVVDATLAFHLAYCDELYAPLSEDFLTGGKTPAGFDVEALLADLAAIGTVYDEAAETGTDGVTITQVSGIAGDVQTTSNSAANAEVETDFVPESLEDAAGAETDETAPTTPIEPQKPELDQGYYWNG